MMLGIIKNN